MGAPGFIVEHLGQAVMSAATFPTDYVRAPRELVRKAHRLAQSAQTTNDYRTGTIAMEIEAPLAVLLAQPGELTSASTWSEIRERINPPPRPEWTSANTVNVNAKLKGWESFFEGRSRDNCPFPPARPDLKTAYQEGWDAAKSAPPRPGEIRVIDGKRCRFIERELEGEKWEVLGPADDDPAPAPEGGAVKGRTFKDRRAQKAYDLFLREGWMRGDIERFYRAGFAGVARPDETNTPRIAVWLAGRDRAEAGLPHGIPDRPEFRNLTAALAAREEVGEASLVGNAGDADCPTCQGSGLMRVEIGLHSPDATVETHPCDRCPGLNGARVRLANMARDIDMGLTPLAAWPYQLSNPTSATAKATAYDIGLVLSALRAQPPAREDAPPPPTCQRCGGEVSGWVCQECDTPFTENDVGALVFDRLAAPSVWMFRVDGKWELSVIKPQALLNLAPEDVISVPISAQPTANFVAKAKHFLDLAEEAEVKALEGDEGCVWPVEALRAAYAALPFVMTITLGGDHAED